MRFLRALLNSGVFMIILLAAATLYLVYSDAIKREHGIDVTNESSTAASSADTSTAPLAQTAMPEAAVSVVQTATASTQEPIQTEPAFSTQPGQQVQSEGYAPMMPTMEMGQQQPYGMMPQFPMPEPSQMPMPMTEPMMPPMGSMDMPVMPSAQAMMPSMPQPIYQPMQEMAPAQPIAVSNVDRARTALFEGNLDVAKAAYQAELANTNDPDLHGELGNVYFAQQNWQAAAAEYAAAVEGLSAQNRFLQAQYVLGFLMQINPEMGQQAMTTLRTKMYPQTAQ